MEIEANRLVAYWKALGVSHRDDVSLLFLASLLPALSAELSLPLAAPRTTINYGLNSLTGGEAVVVGDRVRASATVTQLKWLGEPDQSALQVERMVEVANEVSQVVLSAQTVARLMF